MARDGSEEEALPEESIASRMRCGKLLAIWWPYCHLEAVHQLHGAIEILACLFFEPREKSQDYGLHGWAQRPRLKLEEVTLKKIQVWTPHRQRGKGQGRRQAREV
jgi:hypothetical protein